MGLKEEILNIFWKDKHHEYVPCFESTLAKWLQLNPRASWRTLELAITNVRRAKLGLKPVTSVYAEVNDDTSYYPLLPVNISLRMLIIVFFLPFLLGFVYLIIINKII